MTDLTLFHDLHSFWLWIALGAGLLAIEAVTGSGWLLWPAASAAVVALLARFAGLSLEAAVLTFAVLTIVTTLLARRFLPHSLFHRGSRDINDNVARLLGHHGRAVAAFKNRAGRVFIDGKEWAAELDEDEVLEAGAQVEVTGVAGAALKVRGV
jgi:membrane protein implicated in regulation of membrane protease activity